RPVPGEWAPRMPERLDEEELADWQAGRNAVYQLAALTIGARLAVADVCGDDYDGHLTGHPNWRRPATIIVVAHRRIMRSSGNSVVARPVTRAPVSPNRPQFQRNTPVQADHFSR